jgi:hypothetical protein
MSTFKTLLLAASLAVVAASANAASREELETGYHGNTPYVTPYARQLAIDPAARGAYAAQPGSVGRGAPLHAGPRNSVIEDWHK